MTAGDVAEPPSWFEASEQVLDPLVNARMLLALVEGADGAGLLRAMRTTTTVADLALATGLSEDRVCDVCAALTANDVAESDGSGVRLTPAWAALTGPAAFAPLASALRLGDVGAQTLRHLSGGSGFAGLSSVDRLAYATAVSPDPFSPGIVAAMRAGAGVPDAVRGRLHDGDRHLELGCGVAGRILCVLQAFPTLTAVGVEQAPDLAAEAERRAAALGVADRFEVVCADATTARLDGTFDVAFWSQFFFTGPSRTGTLATAYQALRPGGMLLAPLLGDPALAESDPHGHRREASVGPGGPRALGRSRPVARRSGRRGRAGRLRRRRGQCRGGRRCPRGGRHPALSGSAESARTGWALVGHWDGRGGPPTIRPQEVIMLTSASVTANIPAADLDRARAFYADTLGLTPAKEIPEGGC